MSKKNRRLKKEAQDRKLAADKKVQEEEKAMNILENSFEKIDANEFSLEKESWDDLANDVDLMAEITSDIT